MIAAAAASPWGVLMVFVFFLGLLLGLVSGVLLASWMQLQHQEHMADAQADHRRRQIEQLAYGRHDVDPIVRVMSLQRRPEFFDQELHV